MNRTALWDLLLKQEDDVFARSYINFNLAGKTAEMKNIPVVIEFVDGHVLRTSLEEAKFFDMPESHASIKIKQVNFPGSVRNFVCPKSRLNFTASSN